MKTSELSGRELDAWVAKALGYVHLGDIGTIHENDEGKPYCLSEQNDWWRDPEGYMVCGPCCSIPYEYSTRWEHGGPVIEEYGIRLVPSPDGWSAGYTPTEWIGGETALEAAMRAFVAAEYGEEVK